MFLTNRDEVEYKKRLILNLFAGGRNLWRKQAFVLWFQVLYIGNNAPWKESE